MLQIPPPHYRSRRGRAKRLPPAQPPAALTLVQAELASLDPAVLLLRFDRAIDVSALNAAAVTVNDPGGTGWAYAAGGVAGTPDAQSVLLSLAQTGPATGTIDTVSASAASGIVAVDDGGTWAGVSNLLLPYP